jgi:hypothetical protein
MSFKIETQFVSTRAMQHDRDDTKIMPFFATLCAMTVAEPGDAWSRPERISLSFLQIVFRTRRFAIDSVIRDGGLLSKLSEH